MIYSYSKLSTFENCRFQYKLRYIDKIIVEKDTIERFLGNVVHSTLEYLYNDVIKGGIREKADVIKLYHWFWKKEYNDKIVIVKKQYGKDHYKLIGERCVERYYNKYFPFNQNKILGMEEKIQFKLDESGKYILNGVIDRLDETPKGDIEIHDYKTGMTLPSDFHMNKERQLPLYQIGIKEKFGKDKNIYLIWHYLAFDHEFNITKTEDDIVKIKNETINVIDEIEKTTEFTPKKSPLCNYCEYFGSYCPK
jgi:DNA helicase-2/ATP-dependent DNA helicase PcrA